MSTINVTIDNVSFTVEEGTTILDAAKSIGIKIPTLCFLKEVNSISSCRICVVEVRNREKMVPACSTPVWEGMDILTNTKRVRDARKDVLELILATHPMECTTCIRNSNCELKKLCEQYNIRESSFKTEIKRLPLDDKNSSIVRDENKCIKCGRCVAVCQEVQGVGILNFAYRSHDFRITTPFDKRLDESGCIYCGQCTKVCPVGAIYERENIQEFWNVVDDNKKHVVVQIAPAVRVSIGEEFGFEPGVSIAGEVVKALKMIGVNKVFDTNFSADLTIMEEASELIHRIKNNGKLPLMTSCSPGWINYVEKHEPEFIPNLSTCKSPQQMFGAITKSFYAEKMDIDPSDIVVISIMPCTAKKHEAAREEMQKNGIRDVDVCITTRELARIIKEAGIDMRNIEKDKFDLPLGYSSGAGVIFGTTGGVMEAALRTAYEKLTEAQLGNIEFEVVRGEKGIKEAEVNINGNDIKIAVVHGIQNAKRILQQIKDGKEYHFVEVMCCPGGCIGGGGQPHVSDDLIEARRKGLYREDRNCEIRKSHENPYIIDLYKDYLGEPLSHKAHELLHTHYEAK